MHPLVRRVSGGFAIVALAATALVFGADTRPASACSCATTRGDDIGAFGRAEAVFLGVLVEVRTPAGERYSSADSERFVFDVERVYKGEVFARQSVVTARDGASCGLEVSRGVGAILVFARARTDSRVRADDGEVVADLCGGTRYAIEPIPASFGGGAPPRTGTSPIGGGSPGSSAIGGWSSSSPSTLVTLLFLAGVAVLAFAALGGLRAIRRR